jgi:CRP-like cAMP-binding protein
MPFLYRKIIGWENLSMCGSEFYQQERSNRLLAALPPEAYRSLQPNLEIVSLAFKQVLFQPQEHIPYVYFPTSSLVSLFTVLTDSTAVEIGIVGNEGMIGIPLFLGTDRCTFRAIVQIPGKAVRLKASVFQQAIAQVEPLSHWLQRYINLLLIQISQTSACNSRHSVEQRCCRWLLTMHDSTRADEFDVTQELLAQMLCVRRASVTEVALKLQKAGILRYSRGKMTICDRQGLEAIACECYGLLRSERDRLFSQTS